MDAAELKRWLASVARLTPAQKAELLNALSTRDDEAEIGPLSKTPLARLRMKAKWLQQEDVLARGPIIRLASAELGVAASTAFRWRHRFLQLAQPLKAPALTGVVEADETFFLRSSKGQRPGRTPRKRGGRAPRKDHGEDLIPILVARDRSGATVDFLLGRSPRFASARFSSRASTPTPSFARTALRRWRPQPRNWVCTTRP